MKCPDCSQELIETPITNIDKSFRCENCGGFWVEPWVVNRVAEGQMRDFPAVKSEVSRFSGKTNKCPVDGFLLYGDSSEQIPPEVVAVKCSHCGWWWFGGDNLQKFKKAYEAKVTYLKWWKGKREVTMLALPAILVLLLVVGLSVGTSILQVSQKPNVSASAVVYDFGYNYLGKGRVSLSFLSDKPVTLVSVRELASDVWGPVEVNINTEGKYEVMLTNLKENSVYQVQIEGKRYYFITK